MKLTLTAIALLAATGPAFPQAAAFQPGSWFTDGRIQPSANFPKPWQNRTEVPGAVTFRGATRAEYITEVTPQVHVEILDPADHGRVVARAFTQNAEGGWDLFAHEVYRFEDKPGKGRVKTFDVVPGLQGFEAPVKVVLKNKPRPNGAVNVFTTHISAEAACTAMRPEIIGQNVHLSPINPREEQVNNPREATSSAPKPNRSKSRGDNRRGGRNGKGQK